MKLYIFFLTVIICTNTNAADIKKKRIDCLNLSQVELRNMEDKSDCIPIKKSEDYPAQPARPQPRIGMSSKAVLNTGWGEPRKINTTITASGSKEQWVYGDNSYLYFTNGKLTAIQY
ncbi:hypothetical protein [Undibacterium sp. Ren11W]|uniref:hypothetical protein n=1 Tax=Undibacterium sp. Ren11W TaxID=3413045 RepID=UPI003BF10A5B